MHTKDILDRVLGFIQDLTAFYAELSDELPNLRVVVDHTRDFSELKKIPQRYFPLRVTRGCTKEKTLSNLKNIEYPRNRAQN